MEGALELDIITDTTTTTIITPVQIMAVLVDLNRSVSAAHLALASHSAIPKKSFGISLKEIPWPISWTTYLPMIHFLEVLSIHLLLCVLQVFIYSSLIYLIDSFKESKQ